MKNFVIVEDDALKLGRFLKEARSQKKMTITDLENESEDIWMQAISFQDLICP